MSNDTLRDLSRTYALGDIDRETYRLERRKLIERVVAGEQAVIAYRAPEPEARTLFPYDDDEGDTTQEIIPPMAMPAPAPRKSRRTVVLALVITLLAGGAIAWFALDHVNRNASNLARPAELAAQPSAVPLPALLDDFLNVNSWSQNSLRALGDAWLALDPSVRIGLQHSDSMGRLKSAIIEQLLSESALIELGDADNALVQQERLLVLVDQLGLDGQRLRRARAEWVEARDARRGAGVEPNAEVTAPAAAPLEPAAGAMPVVPPPASVPGEVEEADQSNASDAVEPDVERSTARVLTSAAPHEPVAAARAVSAAGAGAAARTNCKAELAHTRRPYCIDVFASGRKGPALVVLPQGEFTMGGNASTEQPLHEVAITYPLAMGMFEISAADLAAYCQATGRACPEQPWSESGYPAVNVNWDFARAYTEWLTTMSGARYRLPNEAEWEYAARAGTTSLFPVGDELLPTDARYSFKHAETTPLAANDRSVNRNAFRLYHMSGNVREWVYDSWRDSYDGAPRDGSHRADDDSGLRVVRGGSYADPASELRSAARTALLATSADRYTGFRVVREIDP